MFRTLLPLRLVCLFIFQNWMSLWSPLIITNIRIDLPVPRFKRFHGLPCYAWLFGAQNDCRDCFRNGATSEAASCWLWRMPKDSMVPLCTIGGTISDYLCLVLHCHDSIWFLDFWTTPKAALQGSFGLACWPWCGLCNFYIARSGEGQSFCSRAPNVGMGQSPSLAPVFVPTWVCVKTGCPIPSNYWLINHYFPTKIDILGVVYSPFILKSPRNRGLAGRWNHIFGTICGLFNVGGSGINPTVAWLSMIPGLNVLNNTHNIFAG